jgi:hypothetical protein
MKPSHLILILTLLLPLSGAGQPAPKPNVGLRLIDPKGELPDVLDSKQFSELVAAVDRGLVALKKEQRSDGSFPTISHGQPAVTALAVMAYISRGHMPGEGPYGELLTKAINYVLSQQKKTGIFSHMEIDPAKLSEIPSTANGEFEEMAAQTYSHAICMLMLGEIYGLTAEKESFRIRNAIENGLKFSIKLWDIRPPSAQDDGGFRYTRPWEDGAEGDVSITGWHTASLRSIRNAGFDVPQAVMDRIAAYIMRNQNQDGGFSYIARRQSTFTMTAAGTLCLALAGKHGSAETLRAATYLSRFRVSDPRAFGDLASRSWPYYGCYYQTQVSIQLGGQLWVTCMGEVSKYLLAKQSASGLWLPDGSDSLYGSCYSTSMAIIALTPVLQILPIYQR